MSNLPDARRSRILEWLQESRSLTIEELVNRLGVSAMTIHRDLDSLVRAKQVKKVHGGVMLVDSAGTRPRCVLCNQMVPSRTAFKIRAEAGVTLHACCPHCGLLVLAECEPTTAALARDFLYGRMVNVRQAAYVLESSVSTCCVPNVLCFASDDDARRFQRGFGGVYACFDDAQASLIERHAAGHHHGSE